MVASETTLTALDLPDSLDALMPLVMARIPSGVGKGHAAPVATERLAELGRPRTELSSKQERTTAEQFGTLGSGNHFVEVCLDERDVVWAVLHSGSRGIGNQLAQQAIAEAKGRQVRTINGHHNFTQREHHHGKDLWITRKGAIRAGVGDEGVIPGSMGTRSYVVTGLGSTASYTSCSHGAGRRMSRTAARKRLTVDSLREAMVGRSWNADSAERLLDEHRASYKDIDQVRADQQDRVSVQHSLRQVSNDKGV